MGFFTREQHSGLSRREDRHQTWEDKDTLGAIRAKGRQALRLGAAKQARRATASRRVRNNRREY